MSYSEEEAVRRLQQLDNTQACIQATSEWFISVKDMAKEVVKLWFKEFRKAPSKKKIAFLHLVNDVIHSGITAAPQYGKLFEAVLPTAFKETAKIQRHSIRASVAHLLIVWAVRRIYSKNFLRQLRFICQRAVAEADTPDASEEVKRNIIAASPFAFSFGSVIANAADPSIPIEKKQKRHKSTSSSSSRNGSQATSDAVAFDPTNQYSFSSFREELARELQTESTKPPEIMELVRLLETLQQSAASSDATTRRAIAQFPPEVSDAAKAVEIVNNASSESEKQDLVSRIAECASQLDDYNRQLEAEASQREQLELNLRAFRAMIKQRVEQAQAELQEFNSQLSHGLTLKEELSRHMSSLPDLHLLPDMTANLDTLPTVGDLFG